MLTDPRKEELKAHLPPHLVQLVLEAEENTEIETALATRLRAAGVAIQDLRIVFALGYVALDGTVASEDDRERAETVVGEDPRVRSVQNALKVT